MYLRNHMSDRTQIWHVGRRIDEPQNDTKIAGNDAGNAEIWGLKVRKSVENFEKSCTFGGFCNTAEVLHRFESGLLQTWSSLYAEEAYIVHLIATWAITVVYSSKVNMFVQPILQLLVI